jgi:stage II sporulation protein D
VHVRLATLALAAALLAAVGSAASRAGQAETPNAACSACARTQAGAVTTQPTFVVTGRGWGHGVGMSQWGAYGYARHGVSYDRILAHYYKGTQLGRAGKAQVRVLLQRGRAKVVVSSTVPFRVLDAAGKVHALDPGDVRLGPALLVQEQGAKKAAPLPGPLTFLPGGAPLSVERPYRGSIQVIPNGKRLDVVNSVGLQAYLYGVVPDEVPDDWPVEALKAQAVAARTYALATRNSAGTFDAFADTRSQVYGGLSAESPATSAAVDATAGQVVTYKARLATTYFFSTSGGRTAAIEDAWPGSKPVPYLVSVADPYDTFSPHHSWGPIVFSAGPLRRKLHLPAGLIDLRTAVNPSSRVASLVVVTPLGELTFPGGDVRTLLDLRSTWFRVGVLSLARPVGTVTAGSSVRLTGIARGVSGATLEQQVGKVAWEPVAKLRVAKDGTFNAAVSPQATTSYRVSAAKVASDPLRVPVAPRVRKLPS